MVERKPDWLKIKIRGGKHHYFLKETLQSNRLHTVCEEARCPNLAECWGKYRTASFMILGDTCTRNCRFCSVKTGLPEAVDEAEPVRVAEAVHQMALRHVHITMVNRDDLRDGGASVMAETVHAIRRLSPKTTVEVLCSDFMGNEAAIRDVVASRPEIFSHNMETVRRLTGQVRSRSDYDRSLKVLATARRLAPEIVTKSAVMLGLGETVDELIELMSDLRANDVDMLNIGQYLQPTRSRAEVRRYWTPDEFAELKQIALSKGFRHCEAGPMVRSSYHAADQYQENLHTLQTMRKTV